MKKWQKGIVLLLIGAMLTLAGCTSSTTAQQAAPEQGSQSDGSVTLLVSAAASLTDVLAELETLYAEKAPETELTLSLIHI